MYDPVIAACVVELLCLFLSQVSSSRISPFYIYRECSGVPNDIPSSLLRLPRPPEAGADGRSQNRGSHRKTKRLLSSIVVRIFFPTQRELAMNGRVSWWWVNRLTIALLDPVLQPPLQVRSQSLKSRLLLMSPLFASSLMLRPHSISTIDSGQLLVSHSALRLRAAPAHAMPPS
jgi:hypothetical protein